MFEFSDLSILMEMLNAFSRQMLFVKYKNDHR